MTATEHPSLAAALAAFQAALPAVHKGATGQVPGRRSYKYADLSDMSATVLPLLASHGLSWITMPTFEDGRFVLRYELLHTSGECRVGLYPLPTGTAWEIGSAVSYGRRYCLSAVSGVAADEDDDGQVANTARPAREPEREQPRQESGVDAARKRLRETCAENGWDMDVVAAVYAEKKSTTLREATDVASITKFREYLFTLPQTDLAPVTNGAAQ